MSEALIQTHPAAMMAEATGLSPAQERGRDPQRFKSLKQKLATIAVTNQVMYFANSAPGFSPTGFAEDVKDIFASGQPGQLSELDAGAIKSVPPQVRQLR